MGFYALAFFLTQIFHEFGHALVGHSVGTHPVMHTAYVEHFTEVSSFKTMLELIAGATFSLLQGLLFWPISIRAKRPITKLFTTWISYHGIINVVGYLFIGSFVKGGDIGKIWSIYNIPISIQIGISIIAFSGFFFLPRLYSKNFALLSTQPLTNNDQAEKWGNTIGFLPGLIATPLIVIVTLPLPHIATLIYISSAFLPLLMLPGLMPNHKTDFGKYKLNRISIQYVVISMTFYLLIHFIGRFIFDNGVSF